MDALKNWVTKTILFLTEPPEQSYEEVSKAFPAIAQTVLKNMVPAVVIALAVGLGVIIALVFGRVLLFFISGVLVHITLPRYKRRK